MLIFIFLGLLLILALLLFVPIEVSVKHPDQPQISLRIMGIKIPLKKKKKEVVKENKSTEEKAEKSLLDLFTWKEKIVLLKKLLSKFLKYSRNKIQIKKIDISVSFGTSDAAKTAVLVGSFWAALYGILPLLDQVFRVRNHDFSVTPIYNREVFSFKLAGIIKTRLVHIIFIGTVLLIEFMKYKKEKGGAKQ